LEQRARKNMALPDFSDRSRFPSVAELPLATADATTDGEESQRWLLAQIKDTMTITQPTLVALDRNGVEFAITLDEDREGSGVDTAWRKGHCIAIRDARRTEGRSGTSFVKVARGRAARGDVRVVPGGLAAVLGLSEKERGDVCAVCGKEEGNRCMGCGEVRYCSKVSFFHLVPFYYTLHPVWLEVTSRSDKCIVSMLTHNLLGMPSERMD
jgi:hypothetical protein